MLRVSALGTYSEALCAILELNVVDCTPKLISQVRDIFSGSEITTGFQCFQVNYTS